MGVIYVVTNRSNSKQYVGQTWQTLEARWRRHCWKSTADSAGMPIAHAIAKYGRESFEIEVVQECSTQEEMDEAEIDWSEKLGTMSPSGYNLRVGKARGRASGDLRLRMKEISRGRTPSVESRRRMSEAHQGKSVSEETKLKLSRANKGKRGSDLCYERLVEAVSGTFELLDPSGEPVTIVNMAAFCREYGYTKGKMSELVRGHRDSYRGWTRPVELFAV